MNDEWNNASKKILNCCNLYTWQQLIASLVDVAWVAWVQSNARKSLIKYNFTFLFYFCLNIKFNNYDNY